MTILNGPLTYSVTFFVSEDYAYQVLVGECRIPGLCMMP